MIEFLASIEPASIPLLAVLLFSLSLYPLGFMLGASCSPCCGCSQCVEGALPDTVTVTFEGFENGPATQTLFLYFTACFGSQTGEASTVTEEGEITSVSVSDGGSGYARLGRVEPTLSIQQQFGYGEGASITINLTQQTDACGLPSWTVESFTVVDGGTGYTDGDFVYFHFDETVTEITQFYGQIYTSRAQPEIVLTPPDNDGPDAQLSAVLTQAEGFPETWYISAVTVTDGGTGYADDQVVGVQIAGDDVEEYPASLRIVTDGNGTITSVEIDEPGLYYKQLTAITAISVIVPGEYYQEDADEEPYVADVTVSVVQTAVTEGSGAEFQANVDSDPASATFGQVVSVSVINGGSGYVAQEPQNTHCLGDYLNERDITLARGPLFPSADSSDADDVLMAFSDQCEYGALLCGKSVRGIAVGFSVGSSQAGGIVREMRLVTVEDLKGPITFVKDISLPTCDDFSVTFGSEDRVSESQVNYGDLSRVTAAVLAGGGSVADASEPTSGNTCKPCCLGRQAAPQEVTVSLNNLGLGGGMPSGDYVLTPASFIIQQGENIGAAWKLDTPSGQVSVMLSSANELISPSANPACLPECWMRVLVRHVPTLEFSAYVSYLDDVLYDFPTCSPPAGTYNLSGLYEATIA